MNDFDAWIFFDGPMPEGLRPIVDALRDPMEEDEERELRALLERLDAKLSRPSEADAAPVARRAAEAPPAPPGAPEGGEGPRAAVPRARSRARGDREVARGQRRDVRRPSGSIASRRRSSTSAPRSRT